HAIIVSRSYNLVVVNSIVSSHSEWFSGKTLIYDAEAMFSLREIIQAEVNGKPFTPEKSDQLIREELAITKYANRIITVSQAEADHFLRYGKKNVFVLGHALDIAHKTPGFQERTGYLFVGAMPSDASPNADSLIWFLRHVWPIISAQGAAHLDIVGLCDASSVMRSASDTVRIHGRVDNISSFYANARLFIVPTRFAAGIPHKAHEAAAQGLPMVVTPLIASQLGWEEEVVIGESSSSFAKACLALYNDPILWEAKRAAALKAVERDCNRQRFQKTVELILSDHS
ncbi:MAG TPA: glycosyl transferase family 2, partial [Nitrosomonas nitrosa]|nr:glycosyl transferase family 2 [Nitrosomonas nitrosa]